MCVCISFNEEWLELVLGDIEKRIGESVYEYVRDLRTEIKRLKRLERDWENKRLKIREGEGKPPYSLNLFTNDHTKLLYELYNLYSFGNPNMRDKIRRVEIFWFELDDVD